jgi:hypothetical protein
LDLKSAAARLKMRNISAIIVADVVRRFSPDQLRMKFSIHTGGSATGSNIFWHRAMAISPPNIVALPHISSALKADSSAL